MLSARRVQVTLFLATAMVLAFEVSLTRICSVLLQYHISFAVVSFAVLGLGLGGFAARFATRGRPDRVLPLAALSLMLVSPAMILTLIILLKLPFATAWTGLLVLILPVFIFTGSFQSLVFQHYAKRMGSFYAVDLAGGALGALLAVVAVDSLGGPINTILLLALVAAVVALLLQPPRWVSMSLAGVAFAVILVQGLSGFFAVDYQLAPGKLIHRLMQPTGAHRPQLVPELQRWDAYSRVDVLDLRTPRGNQRLVFIDGETPTAMLPKGSATPGRSSLEIAEALPALPYRLLQPQRVLSIGSGGGYDAVVAKRMGSQHIDAVEINAGVLEVVEQARDFNGDVYHQPGVTVHHAEGRQFVRQAPRHSYDLIIALLAQSLAGNLKEYALSENYLYTREAFEDYLGALREDGTLALVLNNATFVRKLVRTAVEVLDDRGVAGRECVAVVVSPAESPYDHLLLIRAQPFTTQQRHDLAQDIAEHKYVPQHVPHGTLEPDVQFSAAALAGDAQVRLQPATDNRPFFFHVQPGIPAGLKPLLQVSGVMLLVALILLALRARSKERSVGIALRQASYFTVLGLAFMVVEVLVLQKTVLLVGFPTLNLAVVLAVFLLAAGIGSAASSSVVTRFGRRGLIAVILFLCVLLCSLVPLLEALQAPFDSLSITWRCVALALALFPFAFLMGMPFPIGVRLLEDNAGTSIPVFWGLNGIASVFGSTLAVAMALLSGFQWAMLAGAAFYLLAMLLSTGLRSRPHPS